MTATQIALNDFCEIIQGGRHKLSGNDFVEHGFPAYGAGGMNGRLATWEFDEAAVVLSSIGARCGKCFYVDGKWSSLANTQVIRPNPEKADCKFLWFQLNDESRWPRSGTGQPFIKPSDVKKHLVHLPPLPEQRRIAAILDKADALRTKRREALARLDRLAESIFVEMFGHPRTNPRDWPTYGLLDICSPKQWPTITSAELVADGYPVYGANGIIGRYTTFNHDKKTVLITCRGATCGTINVCEPMSYVTGNSMALDSPDPELLRVQFLEWALRVRGVGEAISGSAQPQITRERLAVIRIPVPPVALQETFARRVDALAATKLRFLDSAKQTESLFASILTRAFNAGL